LIFLSLLTAKSALLHSGQVARKMSIRNVALAVTTFWCSLSNGLAAESTCAENVHACNADTNTGGVGILQKKRSLESATVEDNAEDAEMDAALTREMQQAMARDRARVKMRLEQDLSKLSAKHYRTWDPSTDCYGNADQSFQQFMGTSNLAEEMNTSEIECFRRFFDEHVVAKCKSHTEPIQDYWQSLIQEGFEEEKPVLTDKMAAAINSMHGGSFSVRVSKCMPTRELKSMEGDKSDAEISMLQHSSLHKENKSRTPSTFNPKETWSECSAVIDYRDHNQGTCGSCWAFASAHVLESRICIASGGLYEKQLSRTVLTSCASTGDGCEGGMSSWSFNYIASNNVPSGGANGCVPYFAHGEGVDHFTDSQNEPACPTECIGNSEVDFVEDSIQAPGAQLGGWSYTNTASKVTTMKNMIMQGPIYVVVYVGSAFQGYSSGVFDSGCGMQTNHAMTGIGWGSLGGQDYFDTINSWGSSWGDNGGIKVAYCVIQRFHYPGDLTDAASGWHFTPAPPTPPPTIPPPTPPPAFSIDGTGCMVTEDGCVASENYPGLYDNGKKCTVQNLPRPFTVVDFNTEGGWDKLKVGGAVFSGNGVPDQLASGTLEGDIEWSADVDVQTSGWKICPPSSDGPTPATATPTANPTAMPTAKPTAPPMAQPTATPTANPTAMPTAKPTAPPMAQPTAAPMANPTATADNVFDMIDADGDNAISRSEFENAPLT
jgi:hypothetical protein